MSNNIISMQVIDSVDGETLDIFYFKDIITLKKWLEHYFISLYGHDIKTDNNKDRMKEDMKFYLTSLKKLDTYTRAGITGEELDEIRDIIKDIISPKDRYLKCNFDNVILDFIKIQYKHDLDLGSLL